MDINDLISCLETSPLLSLDSLNKLLFQTTITIKDVQGCIRFNDEDYARNSLYCGMNFEILILCWKPNQQSPIHDHAQSSCAFKVIEGTATETKYDNELHCQGQRRLLLGDTCTTEGKDIHRIANLEDGNLITVHVYSPPLSNISLYDEQTTAWIYEI